MIDESLCDEIAAATCGTSPDILAPCVRVLGIEAITKERWRAWLRPQGCQQALLFLVSLRSNCDGRAFDLLPCLNIACWCLLHAVPAGVPIRHIAGLVDLFDRHTGRSGRRRYQELSVARLPLPFCDPGDRFWVFSDPARAGQSPTPARTLLAWQHGNGLFLAVGWHRSLSPVLAASQGPVATTSPLSLARTNKHTA